MGQVTTAVLASNPPLRCRLSTVDRGSCLRWVSVRFGAGGAVVAVGGVGGVVAGAAVGVGAVVAVETYQQYTTGSLWCMHAWRRRRRRRRS
jgi:hypothetical protein